MSIDRGMDKEMWQMYTMEYYSAMERNKIMPPAATQLDLEIIILSEASHRKTNTSWHRLYEESKINNTNELIYSVEAGSQT